MTLSTNERLLLQRIVAKQPERVSVGAAATQLSENYGVGCVLGRHVIYTAAHWLQARKILESHDVPLQALSAEATRSDAAQYGGMSEKSGTRPVHDDEVAFKLIGTCRWDGKVVFVPPAASLVGKVDDLLSIECDVLCAVENWEAFCNLHRYQWLDWGSNRVLAVFWGDSLYRHDRTLRALTQRHEPIWAFMDFDPAGLGMVAAGLPNDRLERFLLPPKEWLLASAKTSVGRGLYAAQVGQWGPSLNCCVIPCIAHHWKALQFVQAGVTQERMLGCHVGQYNE